MIKNINKKTLLLLAIFLLTIIFTRFYNLDQTARFTRDESSDLVRMHQYFVEKRISLVGPISSEGDKVFSSLTYYMVMPFAIADGFTPLGPVYGTAFWGVITAILLLLVGYKVNKKRIYIFATLVVVWFPLVEMSRWAWNPHLVIFWSSLAFFAYFYKDLFKGWHLFLTGLFLGFLFHHHYIAFLATTPFIFLLALEEYKNKNYKQILMLGIGYALPFLPFFLFDLKNPPGLFVTQYLLGGSTPHVESSLSLIDILVNLKRNYFVFLETLVQSRALQYLLMILIPLLAFIDFRQKSYKLLYWLVPAVSTVFLGVFLGDFQLRYVYPALGFLFIYLMKSRKDLISNSISYLILLIILIGSLLSIWPQLHTTKVQPDLYSFIQASNYIEKTIKTHQLNNANVAALAGRDPAPLAETYRDVIRMNGAGLRESSEYDVSEHLFVISTNTQENVWNDESYAIQAFHNAELKETFEVPNSDWKVYWYGY
jgi:hypothetical protein